MKPCLNPQALRHTNGGPSPSCYRIPSSGGAEGIRTPDLLNAIEALSQLSYSPSPWYGSRVLIASAS